MAGLLHAQMPLHQGGLLPRIHALLIRNQVLLGTKLHSFGRFGVPAILGSFWPGNRWWSNKKLDKLGISGDRRSTVKIWGLVPKKGRYSTDWAIKSIKSWKRWSTTKVGAEKTHRPPPWDNTVAPSHHSWGKCLRRCSAWISGDFRRFQVIGWWNLRRFADYLQINGVSKWISKDSKTSVPNFNIFNIFNVPAFGPSLVLGERLTLATEKIRGPMGVQREPRSTGKHWEASNLQTSLENRPWLPLNASEWRPTRPRTAGMLSNLQESLLQGFSDTGRSSI